MAHINRIKVVLVEQGKTGKWLAEQLGKSTYWRQMLYFQLLSNPSFLWL